VTPGRAPGLLLASLPGAIERAPAEEVLLVAPIPDNAALVASVPLPVEPGSPIGMLWPACVAGVEYLRTYGVRAVVIVAYASPSAEETASLAAGTLHVLATQRGIVVLDTLRVTGNRWWSYECDDPKCCPPEGSPVPTPGGLTP
jgi:hypothetical protein